MLPKALLMVCGANECNILGQFALVWPICFGFNGAYYKSLYKHEKSHM
jgi:hypothetical protein